MTDKVVVVTSPDDVLIDGYRILIVGLTSEQSKVISDTLLSIDYNDNVILYIWESGDSDWLLDKKHKSNLIIFNADHDNQILVGYMAAQKNSHYFGYLKFLASVNAKSIYASEDVGQLLTNSLNTYD